MAGGPDGALRGFDIATLAFVVLFAARFVVQQWLYDGGHTGWLAVARIGMGYPLLAVALLVVFWAVRRANRLIRRGGRGARARPADDAGACGNAVGVFGPRLTSTVAFWRSSRRDRDPQLDLAPSVRGA